MGSGDGINDGDLLPGGGGKSVEGETEAGSANMRLACVGHGKNSLLTRRHAGGAGGAGGAGDAGDAASSEATYELARLTASRMRVGQR